MAKKLKSKVKGKIKEKDLSMPDKITESARQIWLAGLAAFEKAQDEGNRFFDNLVERGLDFESRTKKIAGSKVRQVRDQATNTWDRLEDVFEERVARTLATLGVPTREDVQQLTQRIERLRKAVAELNAEAPAAPPGPPSGSSSGADDLKKISGIGPALESKLRAAGVNSYQDIAAWTSERIQALEPVLGRYLARVQRDDWIGQAARLHRDKHGSD